MTEPLSVAAGVAGLISLGIQVTQNLVDFYNSYKNQDDDVTRATGNLKSLLSAFKSLSSTLQSRTFQPDEQDLLTNIELSVYKCEDIIQDLQEKYKKCKKEIGNGIKGAIKTAGRQAAYPFKERTLRKLNDDVNELRDNLSLALEVLQLRDHKTIQDDITGVRLLVEAMRATQISTTIRDWLKAPDATINHQVACAKHHPGTGLWFVKSSRFTNWLSRDNSFLWLSGFAGCGKSVLCSTAIQRTFRQKNSNRRVGIAFFYFTFNDESKQDVSAMLRALLLQLSGQAPNSQTDLARLRDSKNNGAPQVTDLMAHLQHMIQRFDQVYILLDALDESPQYDQRDQVLHTIQIIRKWPKLHLLVTSRDELDIRESLVPTNNEEVIMKNAEIDKDISDFISNYLKTDRRLSKLEKYHSEIQQALTKGAHGVFRWVECQFESLKKCPKSPKLIRDCLRSLAPSLDKTYERILCSINAVEEARKILAVLCFSSRPLTIPELIDAIAVDDHGAGHLDVESRLQDKDDICSICPGLIDVGITENNQTDTLRIAHFSVQEYLESDRIQSSKARHFALKSVSVHAQIAQISLIYLQEPGLSSKTLNQAKLKEFPLAQYAASLWYHHYQNAFDTSVQLNILILRIFLQPQSSFFTWVKIHDLDKPAWNRGVDFTRDLSSIASPAYYASLLGLHEVLHELIDIYQDAREKKDLVNAQGGEYGNALQAASWGGHEKVVQMLMDAGADVNAQGGRCGNALQAASSGGREKVVQMLMDAGANVNAHGRIYGNALQAASEGGHEKVVQMLIDAGADVNARGGSFGNALQGASLGGHEKVVQMLMDAGADVNAQRGGHDTALCTASLGGHEKVVQMLMDAGANVNAQGGIYGTALQAASLGGHEKIMEMLMDAGANVNAQGGDYGNALQAASWGGHEKVVQMLMDAGANVNAQGGEYGNELQAASWRGHETVVQMLMDAGANVNAQGGDYGNALQAASSGGHETVVQMLMDAGADVNAQGGWYGNALQAASLGGHETVVQMLMDAGADVNAQGGYYVNALQAASVRGHETVVQMLMDAGADVNAQGGDYGNALQAASEEGHEKVVQMLMDAGANVNAQDGDYGNALQAASLGGHEKVVQMLMDAGANVNAQGGIYGTALQAASWRGHETVAQMLMDAGANVNAQGGRCGNALQAASSGGREKVVQMLIDAGAVDSEDDTDGCESVIST